MKESRDRANMAIWAILAVAMPVVVGLVVRTRPHGAGDPFAPMKPGTAPRVAWTRALSSGVGGGVVVDRAGSAYLWYAKSPRVLKYDRLGKLIWDKEIMPPGPYDSWHVFSNPQGDLFVSRRSRSKMVLSSMLPNGTLGRKESAPEPVWITPTPQAIDSSGGWVAHGTGGQLAARGYISRYAPTGKRVWCMHMVDGSGATAYYDSTGRPAAPWEPVVDSRGNAYQILGAFAEPYGGSANSKLVKLTPGGTIAWRKDVSSGSETVCALCTDPAGGIHITGQHGDHGYYIAEFDPNGHRRWLRQSEWKLRDRALSVHSDKLGNTYVLGSRFAEGFSAETTQFVAKHDTSGRLLWRMEMPNSFRPRTIALDGSAIYMRGTAAATGQPCLMRMGG